MYSVTENSIPRIVIWMKFDFGTKFGILHKNMMFSNRE